MKNRILVALGISVAMAALSARAADKSSELVYFGTRGGGQPAARAGGAPAPAPQGIYAARLDVKTGHLTPLGLQVELQRATWLVTNPSLPVIYSVASGPGGLAAESEMHSFAVDAASGKLRELNKVGTGGKDATHVAVDGTLKALFIANHGSGDVTVLPLNADGSLGPVASDQKTSGTGPHRRQNMPQPHGIAVHPGHDFVALSDFGADRLYLFRVDRATRALSPAAIPFEPMPMGSGPRHLAFRPDGRFLYVNSELTAELFTFAWDAKSGAVHLMQRLSPYPANYAGTQEKSSAESAVSRDGRYLYISLRGDQNSLVVYAIDPKDGTLKEIQRLSSQGNSPWSFGIDPTGRWLLVTNVDSSSVAVFSIDRASGRLSATGETLAVPQALAVTFLGG
jgi:6-phosphogluconolactonase